MFRYGIHISESETHGHTKPEQYNHPTISTNFFQDKFKFLSTWQGVNTVTFHVLVNDWIIWHNGFHNSTTEQITIPNFINKMGTNE